MSTTLTASCRKKQCKPTKKICPLTHLFLKIWCIFTLGKQDIGVSAKLNQKAL
jgi:hypothetical protein